MTQKSAKLISHQHKCIFVHIPKTAGTSVERIFGHIGTDLKRGRQDHRRLENIQKAIWPPCRRRYYPTDFARFVNQRVQGRTRDFEFVSSKQFDSYYKFTIVRNPWDRVFSWYRNVMRDPIHQVALSVAPDCSFQQFVEQHLENWALKSQIDWIINEKGQIPLDFIGRFEALDQAFDTIRAKFKLQETQLPVTLYSGKSNYRNAYSQLSRKRVAKHYAQEIEMFNYSF